MAQPSSSKPAKRTRVVKRRGQARNADLEDDIIERAALSDTDSDGNSGTASDEDEDEHEHKVQPPLSPRAPTAETGPPMADATLVPTDITSISQPLVNAPAAAETSRVWSDMVASEQANTANEAEGVSDLPIIDFADLAIAPEKDLERILKPNSLHGETDSPIPVAEPLQNLPKLAKPRPMPAHVTARQTYLQKLNSDPSFIPRVGQFWGHDDRLLEKDLRGMSDWWRGRWMSRGRGGTRGSRGTTHRGRGINAGPSGEPDADAPESTLPIDAQKWTHDGFEELLKQDDDQSSASNGARRGSKGGQGASIRARGRAWSKDKRGRGGKPTATAMQAQLQAQAAAQVASSATQVGPSASSSVEPQPPKEKKPKPTKPPRANMTAVLAQAKKERTEADVNSVVSKAKNDVAVAVAKGELISATAETSVPQAPPPPPEPVRVNLPKKATQRPQATPESVAGPSKTPDMGSVSVPIREGIQCHTT